MDMNLLVNRRLYGNDDTIGDLSVNDNWECYTLEPTMREVPGKPTSDWKVQNKTAIPVGRYQVVLTESPHFQRLMPLLLAVPGFEAVRIHWGNTAVDTDACILVGQQEGTDEVDQSRAAFEALYEKIEGTINAGDKVWITVQNQISTGKAQAANED